MARLPHTRTQRKNGRGKAKERAVTQAICPIPTVIVIQLPMKRAINAKEYTRAA